MLIRYAITASISSKGILFCQQETGDSQDEKHPRGHDAKSEGVIPAQGKTVHFNRMVQENIAENIYLPKTVPFQKW